MQPFVRKPLWYKDAVIYEVHVKCFADSDGSGMGDFRGLIDRLDYIRDLGVDAIWLLPFYPSPLRDDGYDIADYRSVHPEYGTLETFREFLDEAHARGIHVITELVINHTSDQHPWFQRARRAPAGSPERDYYVWAQGKDKYRQARIIFKDYEPSNWAWDPVARAHYWHRFYSHQPDLNFDNPAVHDEVLAVLDFWLGMGVDGLRLDAVPYLYEREGTNCENLPETHAFLEKLSAHVRDNYDNRMLLAEANQWPEDATAYFGEGRGCDMAFHFPLMTRLYMAVETEDRFPVVDILDQTPAIPDACQWAIFLRNHDELTLEMVTDEERDYMYRVFAKDRRARLNLGIRRRLAPLLGNSRRKMELMNTLLLSLPGTPVIYYGDEIGMGDNYYLGDRDGVRTPMQWSADRNAGFSRAPSQRLYLPVVADAEHHFEAVNVEAQESNPSSLLWWMRRRIRLRQAHPVFGRGSIRFLDPDNSRVLAFVRETEDEAVLVVANLSQHPQATRVDLSAYRGVEPLEMTGGAPFPAVEDRPYPLTLGGHDTLWILLREHAEADGRPHPEGGEGATLVEVLAGAPAKAALESHVAHAAWFEGRSRPMSRMTLRGGASPFGEDARFALATLRIEYVHGDPDEYALWVGFVPAAEAADLPPRAVVARARVGGEEGYLCEAQYLATFRAALLGEMSRPGERLIGRLRLFGSRGAEGLRPPAPAATRLVEASGGEFRIIAQNRLMLRGFHRLREGRPPDLEILEEVKSRFPKSRISSCTARVEYVPGDGGTGLLLGYVQRFVPAERTARDLALEGLRHFLAGVASAPATRPAEAADAVPVPGGAELCPPRLEFQSLPRDTQDFLGGAWSEFVFLLGQRLAELHRTLAKCGAFHPDFAPEPVTLLHQHSLYYSIRTRLRRTYRFLERRFGELPPSLQPLARAALDGQAAALARLRGLVGGRTEGLRIRVHGDPRLERILFTGKDFVFTSLDGPPWLASASLGFRILPLHDVAAILCALARFPDEAATGYGDLSPAGSHSPAWGDQWAGLSGGLFLDGYFGTLEGERLLPAEPSGVAAFLEAFMMERLAHDAHDFMQRPEAAAAALRGLALAGGNSVAASAGGGA